MSDKLYVSALNFKSNTLSEASEALQGYLNLKINPILTNTDILMSVLDYTKTLTKPTEYIDVLSVYDQDGKEIRNWFVEIERRKDGVIQGRLIKRGIGCMRFTQNQYSLEFISSGVIASDNMGRNIILRMSNRLGLVS